MNRFLKFIIDNEYRFDVLSSQKRLNHMSDKKYLEHMYKLKMGEKLDLNNPRTYNEKLQWLKLYDRKDIYTMMVDKYDAKKYVANIIGNEFIIPTLGVWNSFSEIDFDKLPHQFVLKCTHDSGGLIIVKDKNKLDLKKAKSRIEHSLHNNFFYYGREWPYKNVKPRIIAEQYMFSRNLDCYDNIKNQVLNDYKIYTFNGKARICMINNGRGIHTTADYFDESFNWLDFTWGYPHASNRPLKPKCYEELFRLAEVLAKGTIELRVDFYVIDDKIYFGELTFFDGSGFDQIEPKKWDVKLGGWIDLQVED